MPEHPATPVRVYLSTVPGDAAGEREILTRDVFPELERRATALGIAILLVEPEEDWDLARRFAEIDTCRLFVGILCERYGEPPPRIPDDLRLRHDWLADAGRSTAELEIRYALEAPGVRCVFYLREPDGPAEGFQEDAERLAGLKDLLRASGLAVAGYSGSPGREPFASRVLEDLWTSLRARTLEEEALGAGPPEEAPAAPPMPEATRGARGAVQPEKPLPLHEDVRFSVYKPRVVAPGEWYPLLVFAHLDELASELSDEDREAIREIEAQAREAFAEVPQGHSKESEGSRLAVPDEAEITFVPNIPGVQFNPPRATFLWFEPLHREDFRLRASAALEGKIARGHLSVFMGSILLAEINLNVKVDSQLASTALGAALQEREDARPYHDIFASYSHKDTAIVEEFERYIGALGSRYLIDRKTLRAGEVWDDRLRGMIREADVFQLFWSRNAMQSTFVEQEWRYALSLGREKFIRPTYWEDPLPELPERGLPPEDLRRLHFYRFPGAATAAAAVSVPLPAALPAAVPPPQSRQPNIQSSPPSPGRKFLWAGSAVAALLVAFLSMPAWFMSKKMETAETPTITEPTDSSVPQLSLTLGNKVNLRGKIPAEAQSEEFAPDEPVIAALPVEGLQAGTALQIRWIGPDGAPVFEETQTVLAGPDPLTFELKKDLELNNKRALGAYRAEVWMDGKQVATEGFEVRR